MKRSLSLVLALAISANLLPMAASASSDCYTDPVFQYSGGGTVKSAVFMRDQACVSGTSVLATLSAGATVSVVGFTDGWYRVSVNGKTGWVGQQFIDTSAQRTGVVWSTYEEFRSAGSLSAADLGLLQPTETLSEGPINPRDLVKLACSTTVKADDPCKAVYYIGADGKRHAFPNSETFYSWYAGFDAVRIITPQQMGQYMLGANITYRPGRLMVKFTTDPKTYAVGRGGVLRWVKTEELARTFYGQDWNQHIRDIPDTFYANYSFGADISSVSDYDPGNELSAAPTFD
jgi:hypothetical protein